MSGSVAAIPGVNALPSTEKTVLQSNYISVFDYSDQYLPDVEAKEFNRYGNQSISGFLERFGAEYSFSSDLFKWSEEGRLHIAYKSITIVYGGGNDTATLTIGDAGVTQCDFRKGQTLVISSNTNNTIDHAIITAVSGLTATVAYYAAAGGTVSAADTASAFVYGSEFKKGSNGMEESLDVTPNIFEVSPVIIKDKFSVSGSMMSQISWISTTDTASGAKGYYWFLESESKTRMRYNDYLEMMMVEHREAEAGSGAASATGDIGNKGTRGMFESIESDGNVWSGGNPTALPDWDSVIQRLDKQGSIQENALFTNRTFATDIDDMLAAQSTGGLAGVSWGIFNNDKDMALNLGFRGFNRSGYNFYRSDWRYLIDPTLRGGLTGGTVNGVLIPTGNTQVRDMNAGTTDSKPFLHVRYRTNEMNENRRLRSWITGGAGGAATSDLDAMEVNFLSERLLCTLGAVNFFIFED
jgi:hypothetical protein